MINETKIERNSIIKYFTDDIEGLGYIEKGKQSVCKDLFIKSDVIEFLKSPINKDNFNYVLKQNFNNNVDDFYKEYKSHIQNELSSLSKLNVAILLNVEIIFKGKTFYLYSKKNLIDENSSNFKHNIFSVISQYTHCYLDNNSNKINNYTFIPDLIFFINGIYFGYLELKFNTSGQNAKDDGVLQIIDKFKSSYVLFEENYDKYIDSSLKKHQRIKYENEIKRYKKDMLKIFYTPIHITSFDIHSLYMIRSFEKIENTLNNMKKEDYLYGLNEFFEKSKKEFKEYPNEDKNWKNLLKNIYSKDMIDREFNYYNLTERNMEINSKGEYKNKNEDSYLVSPRPKQKYGSDKVGQIVKEMIINENNEHYWIDKIKEQIKDLPKEIQNKILEERKKFRNGKYVHSILLSYAAGFGKTNMMGWISLILKDMIDNDNKFAFDTIYLITDRLELKTQLENKMTQMNIDKGMIGEVHNRNQFQEVLTKNKKIIIVNIQKFQTIKDILSDNLLNKLQFQRNAFIIDEIHRSNSGLQHEDMLEMFTEELSKDTDNINRKKNLIIGLTATPKEETLLRFGEYAGCDGQRVIFVPHDEYTMEESIKDGYTLDFSKSITPYAVQMDYYKEEKEIVNNDKNIETRESLKKYRIYENEERIEAISKIIVHNCLDNVYGQIRGYGKAMLACYSIQSALIYHKNIVKFMKEETDKEQYNKYKDTPIHILYTQNNNDKSIPKVSLLNDNKNEKQIINNFKNKKNGIIIVVDKLQTGFDEPRLHTLFLDKEITGVGAIQTCARVNRTTKHKFNCHIIDFSNNNVNFLKNIPEALKEYKGQQYSKTNLRSPFEDLQDTFKYLSNHYLNKNLKKDFIKQLKGNNTDEVLKIEKNILIWLENNKSSLNSLALNIILYFRSINILNNILDISDFKEENLEIFYKKILNIIRTNFDETDEINIEEISVDFVNIGKVIINNEEEKGNNKQKTNKNNKSKTTNSNLIDKLLELEKIKEEKIKEYKELLLILCEGIVELGEKTQSNDIKGKILDGGFSEQDLMILFIELTKKVFRRNKEKLTEEFINSVIEFKPNAYEDFKMYVLNKEK